MELTVIIDFPDPAHKSDIVQLRGPKNEVKCTEYMQKMVADLVENSFSISVPICKQFQKNIIGKGGANIKKIRKESNTKIDLPAKNSNSETIVITGKRANCEAARHRILAIQKELGREATSLLQLRDLTMLLEDTDTDVAVMVWQARQENSLPVLESRGLGTLRALDWIFCLLPYPSASHTGGQGLLQNIKEVHLEDQRSCAGACTFASNHPREHSRLLGRPGTADEPFRGKKGLSFQENEKQRNRKRKQASGEEAESIPEEKRRERKAFRDQPLKKFRKVKQPRIHKLRCLQFVVPACTGYLP
ncbi:uncharacterized protein LOC129734887 [Falco cherrug]|uniref:uncharacterized protein LOC129734887 n=1 Tax=Falco cherrug TaxID=345164 RepID=UPI0024795E89|nr:uncharacterized protein LOC129734887 [Falco cherrug]